MVNLVTILNNVVTNFRRKLELKRMGKSDVRTAKESAPFGTDAVPLDGFQAVYSDTSTRGEKVILGYINRNQLAQKGEHRIYSVDADGNVSFFVYLKNDGTMLLGGDAKNLARFQEMETAYNSLKATVNELITKYNAHVHTGVTTGGGSSGPTTSTQTSNSGDISGAKIEEIKCL